MKPSRRHEMKHIAIAASAVTILFGAYSSVHACNKSKTAKAEKAAVSAFAVVASESVAPRAYVIDDRIGVCNTAAAVSPIAIEVDIPGEALQISRVIHIRGAAVKHSEIAPTPSQTVKRTAKVAATLGRAFVTTVGAVFGSLVDVAVNATASWV
jgi:hypothetical protein